MSTDASNKKLRMERLPWMVPPTLSYRDDSLDGTRLSFDSSADGDYTYKDESSLLQAETEKESVYNARPLRRRHLWIPPVILIVLVLVGLAVFWVAHLRFAQINAFSGAIKRPVTLNDVYNGTFSASYTHFDWLPQAGPGIYTSLERDGSIYTVDCETQAKTLFVRAKDMQDEAGNQLQMYSFQISPNMSQILVETQRQKVWRHSSLSSYYIHSVRDGQTFPLVPDSGVPRTSYAKYTSAGDVIYVYDNDMYILRNPTSAHRGYHIRVTDSGSDSVYNGRLDWVMEEEIYSSGNAAWSSQDGLRIAFLVSDDRQVRTYTLPIYNTGPFPAGLAYPKNLTLRYPKPGYENPRLQVKVLDLHQLSVDSESNLDETQSLRDAKAATRTLLFPGAPTDSLYTEVFWADSDALLVKQTNREQTIVTTWLFDATSSFASSSNEIIGRKIRELDYGKIDGGWVEPTQHMTNIIDPLSLSETRIQISDYKDGYLDVIPDANGFRHIALFERADSTESVFLTSGEWEIDGGIAQFDRQRDQIWFFAARPSTERHLYSVKVPPRFSLNARPLTTLSRHGNSTWADASIDPHGDWLVYSDGGPDVPRQELQNLENGSLNRILTDNLNLRNRLGQFAMPSKVHSQNFPLDMSVLEVRPPGFSEDSDKQYPVMFRVYGGPNSRLVDNRFSVDWSDVLASQYGVVVVVADGQGTGYQGRRYRSPVRNQLGLLETEDQIKLAEFYSGKRWVDAKRIGVWGWSFGGYLTSKIIERNSGVFSLGIAVAPVVDWRMYDSVYTERYMGLFDDNRAGYDKSSVADMTGFENSDFLLIAGSADDNVHFDNEALLLDRLTFAKNRHFRFRLFIDSDHSIRTRGANQEVYEEMTSFLIEKWKLNAKDERQQYPDYNH